MPNSSAPAVPRILALCDTPTVRPAGVPGAAATTGFATVGRNLFPHWLAAGASVDVCAIHFDGWGYGDVPYRLFPAGTPQRPWHSAEMLTAFLTRLCTGAPGGGAYSHVWLLMNAEALSVGDFPQQFAACCKKYGIHSTLYFPVDADALPSDAPWYEILDAVDCAVTFTEYGRREVLKVFQPRRAIHVLPHGLDPEFRPLPDRAAARAKFMVPLEKLPAAARPFLQPDDFCIVAVNKNEWRKDLLRTLEIVKGLIDAGVPAKLILRTAPAGAPGCGGIPIDHAAAALGLRANVDWTRLDPIDPDGLVTLYNAADLVVLTSTGEGWGLAAVEALACGTPVTLGKHTSGAEIARRVNDATVGQPQQKPMLLLALENGFCMGYENRLRRRVDMPMAVEQIKLFLNDCRHGCRSPRVEVPPDIRAWLDWSRIAREFLKLMGIAPRDRRTIYEAKRLQHGNPAAAAGRRTRARIETMKPIPVLGIPHYNRPDLTARCIASIDHPVEKLVVVLQGPQDNEFLVSTGRPGSPIQLLTRGGSNTTLCHIPPGVKDTIFIYHPNAGVAGAWNEIIQLFPAPWWLIANNDIAFAPGDLGKMNDAAWAAAGQSARIVRAEDPEALVKTVMLPGEKKPAGIIYGNHGASWFAITAACIAEAGTFDCNIFPAYLEDCDMAYRCDLLKIPRGNVPDVHAIHGSNRGGERLSGSCTIYSDPELRAKNHETHGRNFEYYRAKWGGNNGQEKFQTPFNDPGWPIWAWRFDPVFRARQQW